MPSSSFLVQAGATPRGVGLRLQGCCTATPEAARLLQGVQRLLTAGAEVVWVDCQALEPLTWQGQRALLQADRLVHAAGGQAFWCGLPPAVEQQLRASGLYGLLRVLPAAGYQGPRW